MIAKVKPMESAGELYALVDTRLREQAQQELERARRELATLARDLGRRLNPLAPATDELGHKLLLAAFNYCTTLEMRQKAQEGGEEAVTAQILAGLRLRAREAVLHAMRTGELPSSGNEAPK